VDELQAQVLKGLLSKEGWTAFGDLVRDDVLNNHEVRLLYGHIEKLHARTDNNLSAAALALDITSSYDDSDQRTLLLEMVGYVDEGEEVEISALHSMVQKFVSRELLTKAGKYIATHLGSRDLDADIALAYCQRAVEVAETAAGGVVDLATAGLPGETNLRPALVGLGLSGQLDASLGGGIAAGELGVFLAPPARGKTSLLCAVGAKAAQAGRGVLHITLEISAGRVIRRYDQAFTGLKSSELIASPKLVAAARKQVLAAGGELYVVDWSYKDVSPNDVRGMVKRLRNEGKKIDLVVIDYLELMRPNGGVNQRQQMRHAYGALGKELRAVAVGMGVPVMTAWQINREGSDTHNVELRHISESWDVVKHSDMILGIQQSDGERDNRMMRLRVLKQRESTERQQVYLHADLNRMIIREGTPEEALHEVTSAVDDGGEVG